MNHAGGACFYLFSRKEKGKKKEKRKGKRKMRNFPNLFQLCYTNNNGAGI